jgi:hypothetical protein
MNRLAATSLRVALVVLLLGALLAQVLVPLLASELGGQYPEVAHLVVPYSVAAILAIACIQMALVAVWRLLSLISGSAIFTVRALRWVDAITVCAAAATVLSAGVMVYQFDQIGGPGVFLALAACVAGGVALVLLLVVMRGLLEVAVAHRSELDEVI